MNSMDRIEKLNAEFKTSPSRDFKVLADSVEHLPPEKQLAWAQILSSAASAEAEEKNMVLPLIEYFKEHPYIQSYIENHAADENRHAVQLKEYIHLTFGYEKKKKTITDQIIYDRVFKILKNWGERKPLPFLATLLFYEMFAEEFYDQLKLKAKLDGLPQLYRFFSIVQKDELRHRAGLNALFKLWEKQSWPIYKSDLLMTRLLMTVVKADINTHRLAFYNRRLRRNLRILGIDLADFTHKTLAFGEQAYQKIQSLRGN